jgi:hypothetical protein
MAHGNRLLGAALSVALGVISAVLSGTWEARAQDADSAPVHYHQVYNQGFASDAEVQSALGDLSFSITGCQDAWLGRVTRSVRVSATGSDYSNQRVVEAVLYRAVSYAWSQCPLTFYFAGTLTNVPRYDVSAVDLYLADGTHAISATSMLGDWAQSAGPSYAWQSVSDTGAIDRQNAAAAAAQQQQAAAQAEQQAQQAAAYAAQQQASAQWWSDAWQTIKGLFWIGVFVAVAIWLFNRREPIARWYYFTFHPHPAESLVQAAIESHAPMNGSALASALSELPPGNSIFRGVRLEQAEQLFGRMQRVSEARIREQKLRAQEGYERAALDSIQEAVALAAVALERAKALYRASQAIRGST